MLQCCIKNGHALGAMSFMEEMRQQGVSRVPENGILSPLYTRVPNKRDYLILGRSVQSLFRCARQVEIDDEAYSTMVLALAQALEAATSKQVQRGFNRAMLAASALARV